MDFMSDRLVGGATFRILTIVDQFSRECPLLEPGFSLTRRRVVECLDRLACERLPEAITIITVRSRQPCAGQVGLPARGKPDFIGGKPENGYVKL
jgi:hypothetical protein